MANPPPLWVRVMARNAISQHSLLSPLFDFCGCMGAAFPPRLRFVFPHACTKRKEKFRFRIWCRDRDVVPAGLDALASAGRANWPIVCAKTTRLFRSQSADFPQNIVT